MPPAVVKNGAMMSVSASLTSRIFPVPSGEIERLSFEIVPFVAADPPPRLSVVALTPSVAAVVNVSRADAVRWERGMSLQ